MLKVLSCVAVFVTALSGIGAQTPAPAPAPAVPPAVQQAAANAWNARDWQRVVETYRALVNADSTLAMPHLRLAVGLTELGRYAEARRELAIAARRGTAPQQVAFRRAIIAAGENRLDSAFAELKRATNAGLFIIPQPGDSLPGMRKIRADSRYAAFSTDLDRNARPCMYDGKFKEFDFWLGRWDVRPRGQAGGPASRSVITKVENGCVVLEQYTAPGYTGQSYNIWDRTRQKWFQYWVDNGGGLHEYSGTFRDGAMRYEGSMPGGPNSPGRTTFRVTFYPFPPDSVRQHGENLQADGTWATSYDLIYTRAPGN